MLKGYLNKPTDFCGFRIYRYSEVGSTNDLLMQAGRVGEKSGATVVAGRQTAGKGSKGRSFYSPPSGMYLSVLVRPGARVNASLDRKSPPICPELSPEDAMLITPAVACAVAEALVEVAHKPMRIKWVNDIYLTGKKVCGILTESGVDECGDRFYVIGIGINLSPPEVGFPEEFAATATTLFSSDPDPVTKINLPKLILGKINNRLNQIPARSFLPDYRRLSILIGKPVTVNPLDGSEPYPATAIEIDDRARLVIKKSSGEELALSSEEVKVLV